MLWTHITVIGRLLGWRAKTIPADWRGIGKLNIMFGSLDALLLARIQFAFTVSFHFIFPAFSIGLASYLAVLNGLWLWKRDPVYLGLFNY
jgi:Cytochrome bd terminal oxidase subunit I